MSHLLLQLVLLLLLLVLTTPLIIHIITHLINSIQILTALIKLSLTTILLSILTKRLFFFLRPWIIVADDDIRNPTPEQTAFIAQDAVNIVQAAFAALSRKDPKARTRGSCSFGVVDGEVVGVSGFSDDCRGRCDAGRRQ